MPRQADFTAAAAELRSALSGVAGSSRQVSIARARDTVTSPTIGPLVDSALGVAIADINRIGGEIAALADLCDHRAQACAEHEAALNGWARRMRSWRAAYSRYLSSTADVSYPHPGPAPVRPIAPAPWVEPK